MESTTKEDGALIELDLPPRPQVVAVARLVVGSLALEDPAFDDERVADLRLAVSEACTNAIQAHLHSGDPTPIRVSCRVAAGLIEVSVRDVGGGFDPRVEVVGADLTEPSRLEYEGGLGIPLIQLLADAAEFRATDDGTEVVMTFGPDASSGRLVP